MQKFLNKVVCGDCKEILANIDEPFADLIFADPPFNIGYKYDRYYDKVERKNYIAWTKEWMQVCSKVLKPAGSFYVAIGDDYAANVKIIADEIGLFMRNWIIWHYTFGQQTKNKFALSHTHILYFVKDKSNFTFIADAARVISDRQKRYKDKRANPAGKMPDDVWDEYPRICGTFQERLDFPCQMPESLIARIIRTSSKKDYWVLDPFSGSGTTVVVAKKLGRNYTGIELSADYAKESRKRIKKCKNSGIEGEGKRKWTEHMDSELKWLYHENKVPTDQLRQDSYLLGLFTHKFNLRIAGKETPVSSKEIINHLIRIRKAGKLGPLRGENIRLGKQIKLLIEKEKKYGSVDE